MNLDMTLGMVYGHLNGKVLIIGMNYISTFLICLIKQLEEIVKAKPKVIGFTVYWTNTVLVLWMKRELKKRLPDTIFVAGGPL